MTQTRHSWFWSGAVCAVLAGTRRATLGVLVVSPAGQPRSGAPPQSGTHCIKTTSKGGSMTQISNRLLIGGLVSASVVVALVLGSGNFGAAFALSDKHEGMCLARESVVQENLTTFHYLDFHVINHQQLDKLHLSHSQDVIVHWPDGRVTIGIEQHIEDLQWLFAWAPDLQVLEHTIAFGGGDAAQFTGVVGVFAGTFTQPMPIGGGNTIPPHREEVSDSVFNYCSLERRRSYGRGISALG